jgi:hypothetical protein
MVYIPFLSALETDVVAHFDRAIGLDVEPGKKITERILESNGDGQTSYTQSCDNGGQRDAHIIKENHSSYGDQYDLRDGFNGTSDVAYRFIVPFHSPNEKQSGLGQ